MRILLLAVLLAVLAPTGVGRAGTILASSDAMPNVARAGRIGPSGGTATGDGMTVRLPRGAVDRPALVRVAAVTGVPAFAGTRPVRTYLVHATGADTGAALGPFGTPGYLTVGLGGMNLGGAGTDDLQLAALAGDGTWSVLATSHSGGSIGAWIDAAGTFGVVVARYADLATDHNILGGIDDTTLKAGYQPMDAPLVVPDGTQQVRLRFRLVNNGSGPVSLIPALQYRPTTGGGWTAVPVQPTPGQAFSVDREWVRVSGPGTGTRPGPSGADLPVRDLLITDRSGAAAPVGTGVPAGSAAAPAGTPQPTPATSTPPADPAPVTTPGSPSPGSGGTPTPADPAATQGALPPTTPLAAALGLPARGSPGAVPGHRSMGANPDRAVTLAPGAATEQEFTVRIDADARHRYGYEFRLTNRSAPIAGAVARVSLADPAPAKLSPGQRQGTPVDGGRSAGQRAARSGTAAAAPRSPQQPATARGAATLAALGLPATLTRTPPAGTGGPVIRLAAITVLAETTGGIHGPYGMTTDQCGVCHRTHATSTQNLLVKGAPESSLCFTCHDGTGATSNVAGQFADATIPANNPAGREYYGHDAIISTSHTEANKNEFGGVLNRHSECGDCHNPHRAGTADSAPAADGWSASGALTGVSGVSVVNGPAGTAPAYTFLDGVDQPITREYQLCLKCHSGFTVLQSNAGFTPSKFELDKGVEFNPNNNSFHPVEAAGTNQTTAMGASLAGTSPYKLWNYTTTGTLRCTSCHASSAVYGTATPVAAGGDLPAHRSANRGILLQNYRDRVLKSASEPYRAADFALCLVCHAEEPFVNESSTATNFREHALHVSNIHDKGYGGTDIDVPGAGQGNALCAECHFRTHSTSYPAGTQSITGSRLVNFAPDVQPYNGVLSWTGSSCTLVCHGETHDNYHY